MRSLVPSDWTEVERRRHRILDALFEAAEKSGLTVKQPDRFSVCFEASGERIDFKLREKHKQVRVPKSPEEVKRLLPGEKAWRQQMQPSGLLIFSIETHLPELRQLVWTEKVDQPLEGQLGVILAALLLGAPQLVQRRREREELSGADMKRNAAATKRRSARAWMIIAGDGSLNLPPSGARLTRSVSGGRNFPRSGG